MATTVPNLHILFFPFMAPGHMLPMVDIAALFAARGADVTFLTTPANASTIDHVISSNTSATIRLHLIPFPSAPTGLPKDFESLSSVSSDDQICNFMNAVGMLRQPFDEILTELRPDCVVSGRFMPWTYDISLKHGIPRVAFSGSGFFAQCGLHSFRQHNPAGDPFVLPGLPHRIELQRSQVPAIEKPGRGLTCMIQTSVEADEVERKNYGEIVNSFYELEPQYAEHYKHVVGRKAWSFGPVSLNSMRAEVGGGDRNASGDWVKWIEGKKPGSVMYICFGSGGDFTAAQLSEMAGGLETAGHSFIWVLREGDGKDCVFEGGVRGRGLVIKGWAPQLRILSHVAVGGFMTHCGWNSSLEGISAGVAMATWPLFAEQFYNERLLVDVLKVGVEVGSTAFGMTAEERPVVTADRVAAAVRRVMGEGGEAGEMRARAKKLKEKARKAVEKGGSSYNDISNFLEELKVFKKNNYLL